MPIDILRQRLTNQCINLSRFSQPAEIVGWMGAVQAQDFAAGKWALGLRAQGLTDVAIEQAFDAGAILRTHILRPTWHFVTPADIRWMLALTAPRINALSAYYFRQLGLDDATFARSNAVLTSALQGGRQLTRVELSSVIEQAGIFKGALLGFTYLMIRAELDGVLCSGARRGKQFTYALLEERVPPAPSLTREEALAELTRRYFLSHGPATLADFAWWSGLAASDARNGFEMVKTQLTGETVEGQTYWFNAPTATGKDDALRVDFLPNFDEYTVAYTDRSAISTGIDLTKLDPRSEGLLNYIIIINGQFAGHWKRTIKKNEVVITLQPFFPLNERQQQAAQIAASRYGAFLGLPVVLNG